MIRPLALLLALLAASPALANGPRIVSLNMCTDQLLLDLARPGQIVGLSPFARQAPTAPGAQPIDPRVILSGTAEEVLVINPDLVVAGPFTKRATREFLRLRGLQVEEFPPALSIADTQEQIDRFGVITGETARAAAFGDEIEAARLELRAAAARLPIRVLPIARRGWVPGAGSLVADLLREAGLVNVAGEAGLEIGGFVGLETVVKLRPDAILTTRDDGVAEDQGRAMLLHPAIQGMFPPERRIVIPDRLTVCGGPMLAAAMRDLARQVARLRPR